MKKKNCRCEFVHERSETLLRNFRDSLARQSKISIARALHDSAEAPAPRFWVSEIRAYKVILAMCRGEDALEGMHTEKQKMYLEIYNRVLLIKEEHPEMPLGDIVFEVVNNPAPRSYLTPDYVRKLIKR